MKKWMKNLCTKNNRALHFLPDSMKHIFREKKYKVSKLPEISEKTNPKEELFENTSPVCFEESPEIRDEYKNIQ